MRRILFLITELDVGGAEKALFNLVTRLDRNRYAPHVACLTGHGEIGRRLEEAGFPVEYIEMASLGDIGGLLRLRAHLKQLRPQVLHSFLFHANVAGRLASIKLKIEKRISSIRVEEPRWWHLAIERRTHKLSDIITCVSRSTRDYMRDKAHIPEEKLVVIPNGIDTNQCDMPPLAVPETWNVPEGAPVVASIGRLDVQKNPHMLLRVAARVIRETPSAIFVFAGKGPLEHSCRSEAKRLGIDENVRWLGWIDDVRPLLARTDLLALTSRWEGMPNAILEAMACRKPVVATKVGGSAELVDDGRTGLLVDPDGEETFAEHILELIRNPERRKRMGIAARARVEREFSIRAMVEKNAKLYD
jgi:starch synthase (maltosyl-transferring)